jgi:hypothetical protein
MSNSSTYHFEHFDKGMLPLSAQVYFLLQKCWNTADSGSSLCNGDWRVSSAFLVAYRNHTWDQVKDVHTGFENGDYFLHSQKEDGQQRKWEGSLSRGKWIYWNRQSDQALVCWVHLRMRRSMRFKCNSVCFFSTQLPHTGYSLILS